MKTESQTDQPASNIEPIPIQTLMGQLGTSKSGLSNEQAATKRQQYGPNELTEKPVNPLLKLLGFFWGPIPWMIEVALLLSLLSQHWPDFFIILVLLLANALVGFLEEYKADNAIAALKSHLAIRARARREGIWAILAARELVPGDIVRVRIGDIVPADARVLSDDPIEVDQSSLTGESLPVERHRDAVIYSGSIVRQGEADVLIFATGANTFFGHTAHLVQSTHRTSHFQQAILKIGNYLMMLALALIILILIASLVRGDSLLSTLQFALVLSVAAIPVAMPTVLSVTMAVGARMLARKEAIVTELVAIEELAGMDILCSDKTGTLTQNILTVGDPVCLQQGLTSEDLILNAALCSRVENQDPIDLAIVSNMADTAAFKDYRVLHFRPFDPVHKRTEADIVACDQTEFRVSKGAPQVILGLVNANDELRQRVKTVVEGFASKGYRTLGVARADSHEQWQYLGIIPLFDPPREQAKETLQMARDMGVNIKMVTGDALEIARETAAKLNLGTHILDTSLLLDDGDDGKQKASKAIAEADGFAQVFPEHKYRIVASLQQQGHIVGMTGDGVNDAPALKRADCGIAVSGASDAARAAASMVLLTPGLSVIIDAIAESRRIFERMNSYAIYRIAETLRVLLFMTLAILVFDFYPLTAVMIVMLALLNDGAILAIAYDNVSPHEKPVSWDMRTVLTVATVLGIIGPLTAFALFFAGATYFQLDHPQLQTLMYLKLSLSGHLAIFLARTRGPFWSIKPSNILLLAVVGTQIIATLCAVYGFLMTPLGWGWALGVWGYAIVCFMLGDFIKIQTYQWLHRNPQR